MAERKVVLDLRDVTYADSSATQLLSEIYSETRAELLVGTVWTQSLAEQITRGGAQTPMKEL